MQVVMPTDGPYSPAGQGVHSALPLKKLNLPASHVSGALEVAPGGQYAPGVAEHTPEHEGDVRPWELPNVPAGQRAHTAAPPLLYRPVGHTPLQLDVVRLATPPYEPGGQGMQASRASPPTLYVPAGHTRPDGDAAPAGQ